MKRLGERWWDRHYRKTAVVLLLILFILMFRAAELKIAPVFDRAAQIYAKNMVSEMVHREFLKALSETSGDFSEMTRGNQGEILSVRLDSRKVNLLKSRLTLALTQEMNRISEKQFQIPLGTVLGSHIFSERGPNIPLFIKPYSSCDVRFEQSFCSAGINQSVYQVKMIVQAQIVSSFGKREQITKLTNDFLLEEQMISGRIPNSYFKTSPD